VVLLKPHSAIYNLQSMYVCPLCHRANPAEAVFCHFDGIQLRAIAGGFDPRSYTLLPHEFFFPSGRCCRTYDDLVRGCQDEWAVASDLLQRGVFAQFLAGVGRLDLSRAAQTAVTQKDPDIALESFLSSLPSTLARSPRLEVTPQQLILGTLAAGEVRQVRVRVANQGKGLLHGVATVSEGKDWLRVPSADLEREPQEAGLEVLDGASEVAIKTPQEQHLTLRVDTRNLTGQSYRGRLTIITNGGNSEVLLHLTVDVQRFACAPFHGARSPRDLAERMVIRPKDAVPLFESGEVVRWFARNGWAYPVRGPTAPGMAAVQQFFEELGLSRPPAVQLPEPELYFHCASPEVAVGRLRVTTADKKWVYVQADTDVVWLRILTPNVCGPQRAVVSFEVDSSLLEPGQAYEATVQLLANAGQRLAARVRVEVVRPQDPLTRRLFRPFALD
jgi:hypothetical protein